MDSSATTNPPYNDFDGGYNEHEDYSFIASPLSIMDHEEDYGGGSPPQMREESPPFLKGRRNQKKKIMPPNARAMRELFNLMNWFHVEIVPESVDDEMDFVVHFFGVMPSSLFGGGKWRVQLVFPENYPHDYPRLFFLNKIYHPNIDFNTGSISREVMRLLWPMCSADLVNLFVRMLPELLFEPIAEKEFSNEEAGQLCQTNPTIYARRVEENVSMSKNPHGWIPAPKMKCRIV